MVFLCCELSRRWRNTVGVTARMPRKAPAMKKASSISTSGPRSSYPRKKCRSTWSVFFRAKPKNRTNRMHPTMVETISSH
jgi:hypothetical protein